MPPARKRGFYRRQQALTILKSKPLYFNRDFRKGPCPNSRYGYSKSGACVHRQIRAGFHRVHHSFVSCLCHARHQSDTATAFRTGRMSDAALQHAWQAEDNYSKLGPSRKLGFMVPNQGMRRLPVKALGRPNT